MSALSAHQLANLAAKNRFSRRFVMVQKGGNLLMRRNEYIFKLIVTNTRFGAICSSM